MILLKNYNLTNVCKAVKVSLLFEARNIALFLTRRRPLASLALIRALCWNLRHLKETWIKRQTIQKYVRKVSDQELQKQMLAPYPPFPLYLMFPRSRYEKKKDSNFI
jgi:hypothetical protein